MATKKRRERASRSADDRAAEGGAAPVAARGRGAALVAIVLVLATVVAYWPSLEAPFYFDDHRNIVDNPLLRDLSWFARPWAVDESGAHYFHLHVFKTRFVTYLSFALNYRWGGLDVTGYHVTSVALHLLTALLVAATVRRALRLPVFDGSALRGRETLAAGVAAALFALHPIQTETVTYVVQRAALLAGLFSILAFWAYLRALGADGRARFGWSAAALAALGAGALSKQNAFVFPLVLLLFDLLFVERSRRARIAWIVGPLAALAIVPLQQLWLVVRSVGTEGALEKATTLAGSVDRLDYFLTQLRVVTRYLGLLLFPAGQTLEHDVRLSRSIAEPAVIACGLLLAALAVGSILLVRRREGSDPALRLVGFGGLWFFLTLAVESSFIPIPDPMLEHRLYLPSVGFFLAIVVLALGLARRTSPKAFARGAAVVLALLATATWVRNTVWRHEPRFWADLLAKSPEKPRVLYNVGYWELQKGSEAKAYELFQRTVARDPAYAAAWIWLGHLDRKGGREESAVENYRRATGADPANWATWVDLRIVLLQLNRLGEADAAWAKAVELAGGRAPVEALLRKIQAAWAIPPG